MRLLALALVLLGVAGAAQATPSTPVYAYALIGSWEGVVSSDGERYRIPDGVSFAPDQAAVVAAAGPTAIRIVELGRSARLVQTPRRTAPPTFGADGRVAYATGTVIRVVGGSAVRATHLPATSRIVYVSVAPDGRRFAATVEWGDGKAGTLQTAAYVVSRTATARVAGPYEGYDTRPDGVWSPDGSKLAFVALGDVWVVNANGSGLVQISRTPRTPEEAPSWSPDGTHLAYASGRNGVNQVYVANASGGERRLTFTKPVAQNVPHVGSRSPAWSPDGTEIAVVTYNTLAVVPAAGGKSTTIATFTPANDVYLSPVSWPAQ